MNAGSLLYLAVKVRLKTSVDSWLVTITITAAIVAPMARNLRKSVRSLLVLAMEDTALKLMIEFITKNKKKWLSARTSFYLKHTI